MSTTEIMTPAPGTPSATVSEEERFTMQQAMDYLVKKGIPCRSRGTFYRILRDFDVKYVNSNPNGKHKTRRFSQAELDRVVATYFNE